jgi:hypothetical protein
MITESAEIYIELVNCFIWDILSSESWIFISPTSGTYIPEDFMDTRQSLCTH